MAWLWSYIALIAGAGIVLGITGGFGEIGFLGIHSIVLISLLFARKPRLPSDLAMLQQRGRQAFQFFRTSGGDRLLGFGLLAAVCGLTLVAVFTQPAALDALSYHLPRIGHWLQDGKIRAIENADDRMNFLSVIPEIVMAWFAGSIREGFRLVVVTQAIGGIMTVGATIGLARLSGLTRRASLLAGGLLLGMANVTVQFTAAQTDLFTTGVLAVSFYLWLAGVKRGRSSAPGALGAGLALGAKGTLFYFAPSLALWAIWLGWRHRVTWPLLRSTLLLAMLGIGFFAAPGFVRNWQTYGNALGPVSMVMKHHHGFDSISGQLKKLCLNLTSFFTQNFDPQSQPHGLRTISSVIGKTLARQLPATDPYTMPDLQRVDMLAKVLNSTVPDTDVTTFGCIALLLFSSGTLIAVYRCCPYEDARLMLGWSVGVMVFFVFFAIMQQWHPFAFRYFVLAAPWIAIVSAWCVEQLEQKWRQSAWILIVIATMDVGWSVTTRANQSGWQMVVHPERASAPYIEKAWRKWAQELDHVSQPLNIALPTNEPIAAFYREWPPRQIAFKPFPIDGSLTAEDFVRDTKGWVIVPGNRFVEREGKVAASAWLFNGDINNGHSVAAYRVLDTGERPHPIAYKRNRQETECSTIYELLVRTFDEENVVLTLINPGTAAQTYTWSTSKAQNSGTIAAQATGMIIVPVGTNAIEKVGIIFRSVGPGNSKTNRPTVLIAP